MKILITSGGTKVWIDSVRYIGNMSTGRYGAELAARFLENPVINTVYFLYAKDGKHALNAFKATEDRGFNEIDLHDIAYNDYYDYLDKSVSLVEKLKPEIIISAAAVSDYVVTKTNGKISSSEDELIIRLQKAQKVLPLLKNASPGSMLVGFKLLVDPSYQEVDKAVEKVFNNRADMVVFNDLTQIRKGNNTRLLFHSPKNYYVANDATELTKQILEHYELTHSNSGNL